MSGQEHSPAAPVLDDDAPGFRRAVAEWLSAACLLEGPAHVFTAASAEYRRLVGGRELLGLPFSRAFPGPGAQRFAGLLDRVYAAGVPFAGAGVAAWWDGDGGGEGVVDFVLQPVRDGAGRVYGVLAQLTDATARVMAERRLAAQEAALGVLAEAAATDETVPRLLEAIGEPLGWECGALREVDAAAGRLRCSATWVRHGAAGGVGDVVEAPLAFAKGEGLPGRAWAAGEPAWIADVRADPGFVRAAEAERAGVRGALAFPVRAGGEVAGVVEFFTRGPLRPDEALLATVASLGSAIGQHLARARLQAEAAAARAEAEARARDAAALAALFQEQALLLEERLDETEALARQLEGANHDLQGSQAAALAARGRAERLQALTAALSGALTPAEVARVAMEQGIAALGAQAGLVALLAGDGLHLEVVEHTGYPEESVRPWRRISLEAEVPLAEAVRTGRPVEVGTPEARDARYPVLASAGFRFPRSLSVPLVVEDRPVGAMGLSFTAERPPLAPEDHAMLMAFGRLCAQAVRRAVLYADAQTSRADAEAANRAKSEFLAAMSHEIRTPINAVVGYTELVEMGIAGPVSDAQRGYLERIRASSRHLLGLVEDVLDLAKVEAGRMEVAAERASAVETATAALALVAPQAAARGVTVEEPCAGSEDHPHYVGDEARVRQVLVNLLSNAVKFTEAGGVVRVECGTVDHAPPGTRLSGTGPWTYLRVADTGVGIDPERLEAMFHPFVQAEAGHTRTRGGTGLGLTISRQLARLMGGDLTAASEPGRGSAFTLWLPARAPRVPALDETLLAGTRGGAERPAGLAEVGARLLDEVDAVLAGFVVALRADPQLPRAAALSDSDLTDHTASFLADLSQCLTDLGRQEGDLAGLMRDGSQIQRTVADLHGAQRARLGWTEEGLRREFALLGGLLDEAVRRVAPSGADVPGICDLMSRFVEHALRVSLIGFRRAAAAREEA